MIHNNFCLGICTHMEVEVEGCSRKSQRLGEGVAVKTGRGEALLREKRDYCDQDGRFSNVLG